MKLEIQEPAFFFLQPVRLAGGSWLLLVCFKRKILVAGLDRD
jgi:hypothetical protein